MQPRLRTSARPESFAIWIALAAALAAGALCVPSAPAESVAPPTEPPALFDDEISCYEATLISQQFVPFFMVYDEPDSLLWTLDWWETNCGSAEPIRRMRLLAAIWDGAFSEELYDSRLIDDLMWRYDPKRTEAQKSGGYVRPSWGSVASTVDFTGEAVAYDEFTVGVADQLLPHQPSGSLEEFFCLFYSGRPDEAWALLRGPELEDTELYARYREALDELVIPGYRDYWGVSWGYRRALGGLADLGHQQTLGAFAGRNGRRWFAETGLSVRLGRASEPYLVRTEDFYGFSDRYAGVSLYGDVGLTLKRFDSLAWNVFIGAAVEGLSPFREADDIVLTTGRFSTGTGVRYLRTPASRWFAGADWRYSWISDPQEGGTDLGGQTWQARVTLGFFWTPWEASRRKLLGG